MHAIRVNISGGPEVFTLTEVDCATPAPTQILVEVIVRAGNRPGLTLIRNRC